MGVMPQDHIGAALREFRCQLLLGFGGDSGSLGAPMQAQHHNVRLFPGRCQLFEDRFLVAKAQYTAFAVCRQ